MKKSAVLIFSLILLFSISFVLAEDQAKVDKAYSCLEGKVNKCSGLSSVEDQAFSILALSYKSDIQSSCRTALMANSKDNECWPKSGCKIKETAEAVLALNYIGQDTSKPEAWLLKQNKTPSDLIWYLEVDARDATTCAVKYDNSSSVSNTIVMASDKKLSLTGTGTCLNLAQGNYWLQITQSCIGKNFKVSCDKDFFTALLYKKSNSDVWYVSSKTQTASASGTTENQISSFCFAQSGNCDYEGSLWAVLALQARSNVDSFLPYIIAFAPDNLKYNPYAFLNRIASSDEYTGNLRSSQNPAGFWDLSSGFGRNYDTAISIIGLSSVADSPELISSKDWLQSVQGTDGCWNTIKDTALILYAAWSKEPAAGANNGVSIDYCEDYSKFCLSHTECADASGEVLENYHCKDGVSVCCSKDLPEKTCEEKQGTICKSDEECSGSLVSATGTSRCCTDGTCEVPVIPGCENNNFNCRNLCLSNEEIKSGSGNDCPGSNVCCGIKATPKSYWWLWILIILIILVVLAIVFRNRIRMWVFSLRNRGGKPSPVQQTRPPFPPSAMSRPMMSPRPMPRATTPAKPTTKSRTDQELDETLKRLKEMSK